MADAKERPEWYRAAIVASSFSGTPVWKLIPERYREPTPEPEAPTEESHRRGWAVLFKAWGEPPKDGW